MTRRLFLTLLLVCFLTFPQAGFAAVVATFWSHDQDDSFPHAFFALKGVPDTGGAPIDANFGFTAKSLTPAILLGTVGGKVESNRPGYMRGSDARFSVTLTDVQYRAIIALIAEWNAKSDYNLNKRNCVHFVAEAARRSGLVVPNLPNLMKKPKSFLIAVGQANPGRVTQINLAGSAYFTAHGGPGATPAAIPSAPQAPTLPGSTEIVSKPR